jgi:hypothetical protein
MFRITRRGFNRDGPMDTVRFAGNSAGRSLLGSNGTENSLKDSGDFDHRIGRGSGASIPGLKVPFIEVSGVPMRDEDTQTPDLYVSICPY